MPPPALPQAPSVDPSTDPGVGGGVGGKGGENADPPCNTVATEGVDHYIPESVAITIIGDAHNITDMGYSVSPAVITATLVGVAQDPPESGTITAITPEPTPERAPEPSMVGPTPRREEEEENEDNNVIIII